MIDEIGVNVNSGLGNLLERIQELPEDKRKEIEADIEATYKNNISSARQYRHFFHMYSPRA